jgi:hypothetical protein
MVMFDGALADGTGIHLADDVDKGSTKRGRSRVNSAHIRLRTCGRPASRPAKMRSGRTIVA